MVVTNAILAAVLVYLIAIHVELRAINNRAQPEDASRKRGE